jgi:predicted extracellular nuclease
VSGLNDAAGAGTYAFIDTGVLGNDEIRVALLYKPGTVSPFGSFAVLDSSVDPQFQDDRNRPALAQTFEAAGEKFTVVVNHLKSKGCDEATGEDLDQAMARDVGIKPGLTRECSDQLVEFGSDGKRRS